MVLAMVHVATADPRPRTCKPAGGLLVEVDQRARTAHLATATSWLYENGSWRTEIIGTDGKLARTRTGCLDPLQVDRLRDQLRNATWKTTSSTVACRSDQPRSTVYKWKSRMLYTERTCNVDVLDEDSRRVLEAIDYYVQLPEDLDGASAPCIDNPLARGCP